jgi:hypothetical protein
LLRCVRPFLHKCEVPTASRKILHSGVTRKTFACTEFFSVWTRSTEASELNSLFSSVYGLATTRQNRCDGNCEILVAAEMLGLTVDVTCNGGER